jgi:predicted dehydrogenase
MRIAFVGCGYVADFYMKTLPNHPELELVGVMDRDRSRASQFSRYHSVPVIDTLDALLKDSRVEAVVNLTNPRSHFEVTRAALEAGKHVYSEKPLGMTYAEAEELVKLANSRGLVLSGAPCGVLGETAQTLWKALRDKEIGKPRLVHAELHEGPLYKLNYRDWRSNSGASWPWKDEFEIGCTLEHAGYYLTWLVAFFGPAKSVTSYASVLVPEKASDVELTPHAPDFSLASIEFVSGVVARISCSLYAPYDHHLRIFGDGGVLSTAECWNYDSPVYLSRRTPLALRAEKHPRAAKLLGMGPKEYPLVRKPKFAFKTKGAHRQDMCRGVAELAHAVKQNRKSRLSSEFCLHVNEIVLAIHYADKTPMPYKMLSTVGPMAPMEWAER